MKNDITSFKYIILLSFLYLFFPFKAYPQSISPDSIGTGTQEAILFQKIPSVYGASKYEQKVTEAPSSVSIVTATEIKKYGYRTLADILRSIRGFFISYDRNYHYVGIRGFSRPGDYNTRVLLLINGHRINDNIYQTAFVGTEFPLDIELIDRIEIIRGPSSSIYGANAFFGVINIITKRGRDLKGIEASGEWGSFQTYKGRLSYGNKFHNGIEMLFSGSYYTSRGNPHLFYKEFADPTTNFGVAEDCDDDHSYNYFGNISFHDLTLYGAYGYRKKGIPTASYDTDFNDSHNWTIDARGYLDLRYEHFFENGLDLSTHLYYDDYSYHGEYIYSSIKNKDFARGQWWGGEFKLAKTLLKRHKVVLGGELNDNFRQDQKNYVELPFTVLLDDRRDSTNWAFYLQDEFSILGHLILNAGIRFDHYKTFGGSTHPRIALVYYPYEKTIFKLLYGSAFRPPNVYELYYSDIGLSAKPNANLKPEEIHTYELVYEQYFGAHLRGTSSIFYYDIKDLITQTIDPGDGLLIFRNMGRVKAKGFELELEGRWENGLEGHISYTFQKIKDESTNETLTNSPKHLAKFNLILPFLKERLFVGVEEQFTSSRKTLANKKTNGFFITNLTLFSKNILKGLEVSASVYNLFNKRYDDPGSGEHIQDVIEQDGIQYRLRLSYSF